MQKYRAVNGILALIIGMTHDIMTFVTTQVTIDSAGRGIVDLLSAGAVVVPGTLPSPNGKYALACAVIVKRVDAQTRAKTSLNELLRNID